MINNRRNFTSIIRAAERGYNKFIQMLGVVSSVSGDGKIINAQTHQDGEVRELLVALPYGISSSAIDGAYVQVIINSNEESVAAGIIDKSRPSVKQGEVIIYSKFGQKIELKADGDIYITGDVKITGSLIVNGETLG